MKPFFIAFAAAAALFCTGCTPVVKEAPPRASAPPANYDTSHYPVTIENMDSYGKAREETFSRPPERVVAVWQNSIETLIALGVGDRIVGAMGLPDGKYLRPEYREVYSRIPYTSMESLDVETVMMQDPDLIVGWKSTFDKKVLRSTEFWNSRNVATYIAPGSASTIKYHTIEYEYGDILNLGKIFDREDRAKKLVTQMEGEIGEAEDRAAAMGRHPRGLIIEYQGKNIVVYGERSLAGDILKRMGGELLAADQDSISREQIRELNPDALCVVVIESDYGRENAILDQVWQDQVLREMDCVKAGKVYALPLYTIYSSGVRTYDGIQIIKKGLYEN